MKKRVIIYDLPVASHEDIVLMLGPLTEKMVTCNNSVYTDGMLVVECRSDIIAKNLIDSCNGCDIAHHKIYAMQIPDSEKWDVGCSTQNYVPTHSISLLDSFSWQKDIMQEQFLISGNTSILYANSVYGDLKMLFETHEKCILSNSGRFICVYTSEYIRLTTTDGAEFATYPSNQPIKTVEFSPSDVFLIIDIGGVTKTIVRVADQKKVFEGRNTSSINFSTDDNIFRIGNTLEIFEYVHGKFLKLDIYLVANEPKDGGKITLCTFNSIFFIFIVERAQGKLMRLVERVSKVVLKERLLTNYFSVRHCWGGGRLYLVYCMAKNGNLYMLESLSYSGEKGFELSTMPVGSDADQLFASDNGIVLADDLGNVDIYKKGSYDLYPIYKCRKSSGILCSINKVVHDSFLCAIYDISADTIAFIKDGTTYAIQVHINCTNIAWSNSGAFLCCYTSGSGLVQMFDIQGSLRWKRIFPGLSIFTWREYFRSKFIVPKEIIDDPEEVKFSLNSKVSIGQLKDAWYNFLSLQKSKILHFYSNKN